MRRLIAIFTRETRRPGNGRPRKGQPSYHRAPPWQRRALRHGAPALVVALVVGSAAWMWTSGWVASAANGVGATLVQYTAAAGLTVREVYVTGRQRTPPEAILEALGVVRGSPLVALDPAAARRRIEALGWVREAAVERRFPDTVFVRLQERVPLALWQRKGKLVVVDLDGVVIDGATSRKFTDLKLIVGDDAPANAPDLLAIMASEPELSKRVEAAVRVGGRRWNLRLDNGIDVQLPETDVAAAWRRLADFDRRHRLLARDITAIDLRLPDRVVVRQPTAGKGGGKGENT